MKSNHVMISAASRIAPFGVTRNDIEQMLDAGLGVIPRQPDLDELLSHVQKALDSWKRGNDPAVFDHLVTAVEKLKAMGAKLPQ